MHTKQVASFRRIRQRTLQRVDAEPVFTRSVSEHGNRCSGQDPLRKNPRAGGCRRNDAEWVLKKDNPFAVMVNQRDLKKSC